MNWCHYIVLTCIQHIFRGDLFGSIGAQEIHNFKTNIVLNHLSRLGQFYSNLLDFKGLI